MHCNDNPQAIEVADRKREQGDQGAGGPPRDANEDSIMLPTAALETSPQVPSTTILRFRIWIHNVSYHQCCEAGPILIGSGAR